MQQTLRLIVGFIFILLLAFHFLMVSLVFLPADVLFPVVYGTNARLLDEGDIPASLEPLFFDLFNEDSLEADAGPERFFLKLLKLRAGLFDDDSLMRVRISTLSFGRGIQGIDNAAVYYFNKPARALSEKEWGHLIGFYRIFR
jgi:hypothetical protein